MNQKVSPYQKQIKKTQDSLESLRRDFDAPVQNYSGNRYDSPGFIDNMFGRSEGYESTHPQKKKKQEFKLFSYTEHYESKIVREQIKSLVEQIKQEITAVKKSNSQLISEVKDIEKLSLEAIPEKAGIYHVRFLEIVLNILRTFRMKIGESRTWMQALISKKKKRGSLFVSLSKKKGTQYSLSQEIQTARSVQ
jgi:hypothetical protein